MKLGEHLKRRWEADFKPHIGVVLDAATMKAIASWEKYLADHGIIRLERDVMIDQLGLGSWEKAA
jgi:hypothetical protein